MPKTRPTTKTRKRKKGGKGGRPPVKIDKDLLIGLCKIQCTYPEIAGIFGCAEKTIQKMLGKEPWKSLAQKAYNEGRASLRRRLFTSAMEGDPKVLIHLSKCKTYLANVEEKIIQHTGKDGGAIETTTVQKHIYMPDNGREN
jgi:hypothetical protein